jgi:16S rRNA (cytidine1402-2'-O)-methyltransferase
MNGNLYIVATPIGNLGDITLRAIECLLAVDFIIAEDARVTLKLLNHLNIKKPIITFHERSKPHELPRIVGRIKEGESAALVTDAGTPGVSDPGGRIIEAAAQEDLTVTPIPGASSVSTIMSVYDRRAEGFCFLGYFPKKGKTKFLAQIANSNYPVVYLDSPFRVVKNLNQVLEVVGERYAVVGRELTKKFETIYRGKISEVALKIKPKGEFIVIIEGTSGKK